MVAARQAGIDDQYRLALQLLVHRHYRWITRKVELRLSGPEYRQHVDDVVGEIILSAFRSAFDSDTLGQFRAWLKTIVHHRCVDFIRVHAGGDTLLEGDIEFPEPSIDDEAHQQLIAIMDGLEPIMPENGAHRLVIELGLFAELPARQVAGLVNERLNGSLDRPMTENNVHQIIGRFRKDAARAYGEVDH